MAKRYNGGIITGSASVSSAAASGVWDLFVNQVERGAGNWPTDAASVMSQFSLSGASPTFNTNSTAWGWVGPSASLTAPVSPYFSLGLLPTANGVRIILQSAGGASSNNDADADSSANSGATAVFDLPSSFSGTVNFWLGPAGPNYSASGGTSQNINPRQIPGITNPLGAYAATAGQAGFAANAAYDAAVLTGSTILGYAEGGAATVNYDSANGNVARPYVNTASTTSVATYNGPVSPGRGAAPSNDNFPSWNFNVYADLATCYGKYSSVAANKYGKGGMEAAISGSGFSGYPGFVWVSIK